MRFERAQGVNTNSISKERLFKTSLRAEGEAISDETRMPQDCFVALLFAMTLVAVKNVVLI